MAEGPFPEHYEPFETPLAHNPLSPKQAQATQQPGSARVSRTIGRRFGKVAQFPHVATTYRLTEHFHYWTKHVRLNAIIQPEQFVEIGEALAKEIGIAKGERLVQRQLQPRLHQGGGGGDQAPAAPEGRRQGGASRRRAHSLGLHGRREARISRQHAHARRSATRNSQTPEFKSFLVKVEKA